MALALTLGFASANLAVVLFEDGARMDDERHIHLIAKLEAEVEELRAAVAKERSDREEAILAQEHRIIPAARELYNAFSDPAKASHRGAAISALLWCLIPSGATAAGGGALIIAILTAVLTLQQVKLMSAQNQQMSVQNALAEAQRRASSLSDLPAILSDIASERSKLGRKPESFCGFMQYNRCFRSARDQVSFPEDFKKLLAEHGLLDDFTASGVLYAPSQEIVDRISNLAGGLRVYRTLADDPADAECLPEPTKTSRISGLATLLARGLAAKDADSGAAKRLTRATYQDGGSVAAPTRLDHYARLALKWAEIVVAPNSGDYRQLVCSPRSPERGQLMLALLRAKVDVSALQQQHVDLRYADLRNAALGGLVLDGVKFDYAVLRNADFNDAILVNASFVGADLRESSFDEAFTFQVQAKEALFSWSALAPAKRPNVLGYENYLEGAHVSPNRTNASVVDICHRVSAGLAGLGAPRSGILIELQTRPDGNYARLAIAPVPNSLDDIGQVWEGVADGYPTKVYFLDRSCKSVIGTSPEPVKMDHSGARETLR